MLLGHTGQVMGLEFARQGGWLVSGGWDFTLRRWAIERSAMPAQVADFQAMASNLAASADGTRFAATYSDHSVRIWNAETGELEKQLNSRTGFPFAVAFSPD